MSLLVDIEKKLGAFTLHAQFETSGGIMALLGASGSGKSVTLKCIAGIMTPDRGRIVLDGKTLFDSEARVNLTPQQRRVGYLFQQYALFPNMTVMQNILCGVRSGTKAERRRKVQDSLRRFRLEGLEKKYRLAPLMLWYMKHCNYEKLKPKLIRASMRHIRNESAEEIAYARDMFETIFKDYKQEKDVHISGLLADVMNQTPVTEADFAALEGRILLILPDQDFFSGKMQQDLVRLMHSPKITYISGGHLSTVLRADAFVRAIREFLKELG